MIRRINQDEIHLLYPFVFRIFSDMKLPLLNEVHGADLKDIVVEAMRNPHYRYGYEHTWVYEENGQMLAALFGYPGEIEDFVDGPLAFSLIQHGYPAMPIKEGREAMPEEWLLDAVVVAPLFRNRGIADKLLSHATSLAKEAGFSKIGVNCPAANKAFHHLLKKQGYKEKTRFVLGVLPFYHMTKKV